MKPSSLAALLKRRADGVSEEFLIIDVRDDDCLGGHIPGRYEGNKRRVFFLKIGICILLSFNDF
jgi:rhodanese-related sulfurtransferase